MYGQRDRFKRDEHGNRVQVKQWLKPSEQLAIKMLESWHKKYRPHQQVDVNYGGVLRLERADERTAPQVKVIEHFVEEDNETEQRGGHLALGRPAQSSEEMDKWNQSGEFKPQPVAFVDAEGNRTERVAASDPLLSQPGDSESVGGMKEKARSGIMPSHVKAHIEAAGEMWNALLTLAPGLLRASRVSRASTSSGLFRNDTGEPLLGSNGLHHYVLLRDGGDAERFLRDLHDRCWLHGLGWHLVGGAGQLLDRSLVDRMVGYGERLCFEGAPIIVPPLQQDPAKRVPQAHEGEAIDSNLTAPRLTEYERHRVNEAKNASAEALGKAAAEVRTRHDRALAEKISTSSGMPIETALRVVRARHRGVLLPSIDLDFDHLGTVQVGGVLAIPDRFVGETLADPLEGAAYGRAKAKVMKADDGGLLIHSFAHGRGLYQLRHDVRSAKAAIAQIPPDAVVDYAIAILAMTDLEVDELEDFARSVSKIANVGVRPLMARINKDRRDRESARRKAAMASNADGRIIRPRPEPDGELLPTVTFLDQLLASDQREEPPMRDASGNLVEVRVREPWELHLLTADGTNAAAKGGETLKAPAEPGLMRLTPTGIEMLLENYVRWYVQKKNTSYFGALPRPFVEALQEYAPSSIPIVRAINTTPLVSMSGNIIDGIGLDRDTGLVHRIDPLLRSCLPVDAPTDQDVRDAMNFLFNEWLTDVALDGVGKSIAVMLALTLIERALLPERPAFFVTAGQRGGGKTTLVHMIASAVLGRKAAAAGWSKNPEERRKALFSYLRQGVAFLAWDNIPRGSALSCPHIEAALTASEISDRVLGVSRVETVPSNTIQIFTGNSIAPLGDLASRSLMLALNVNRPDPENRMFAHPDPLAWTQANRPKILRALYTILIAGALNRPQAQVAKTRFKIWWNLVGWPVEFAARLVGTTVDCTELLRAGEIADEEASAVSAAMSILREIWGEKKFTAKDVLKVMTPELKVNGSLLGAESDDAKEAADTLSAALGELAGKRLDRPTAHSVGKLFQKRLVGRPAWIQDGETIAILRKSTGHNENTYWVDVPAPGQAPDTPPPHSSSAETCGNIPPNPHIPRGSRAEENKGGNVGKDGNVLAGAPRKNGMDLRDGPTETPAWRTRL